QSVRKLMSQNCVHQMRDYSRVRVFKDADVYPVVFVAQKCQPCRSVTMSVMSDVDTVQTTNSILQDTFYRDISWDRYFTGDAALQIDTKCLGFRPLATYFPDVSGAATVSEAYEFKKVVREMDGRSRTSAKQLINTGTIDRYCSLWGIYPTRYLKGS